MDGNMEIPIWCRCVRIGSFKVHPTNSTFLPVFMKGDGFEFSVHTVVDGNEMVKIKLRPVDIVHTLGHFGRCLPLLFVYTSQRCGALIRNKLRMNETDGPYFDPAEKDERQNSITFVIEILTDEHRAFLRHIFPGEGLLQEIDQKTANEILVRSTPTMVVINPPINPRLVEEHESEGSDGNMGILIWCRSIRIGSFEVHPSNSSFIPVFIKGDGFVFSVPTVADENERVKIKLSPADIVHTVGHLGHCLPFLFVYTSKGCGAFIRKKLRMSRRDGPYFDPAEKDERQNSITFMTEILTDEHRAFLRHIFPGEGLLQEIDQKTAIEILKRSTPNLATGARERESDSVCHCRLEDCKFCSER